MKNIKNRSNSRKRNSLIVVAIIILVIASLSFYVVNSITKKSSETTNPPTVSQDNNSSSNKDSSTPQTTTPDTTKDSYVSAPIVQPSINEPFPIENEHYKIVQNSEKKYSVTLYPIVNNPDYTDYPSQLKAYKKEVTDYLSKRFTDISSLSISWTPDEATNL